MTLKAILWLCSLLVISGYSGLIHADCKIKPSSPNFGSVRSFDVAATPQGVSAGAGFSCTNILSLFSTSTITATLKDSANKSGKIPRLYNSANNAWLPYRVCKDAGCNPSYQIDGAIPWTINALVDLLGLFNTSDGTIPLYFQTIAGSNIPAGTYNDTLTIEWKYHYCLIGALGICVPDDGTLTSQVLITMNVTNYCYIDDAPDVAFSTAALVAAFSEVSGQLTIRCTQNAAYSINLSSINALNGSWRQMSQTINSTNYYLQYQLYKTDGSAWTPTADVSLVGNGNAQQTNFKARVNASQSNQPAGVYSDTVLVTVSY
ncbi:TPA: spore coat U domain-containing protein [Klebsiella aerogenes]|nr:spore coat U domain-containing protein [Klebsiella aerogenes]